MQVKTNVRAGQGQKRGGTDNPVGSEDPVVPAPVIPPVSRCVGI